VNKQIDNYTPPMMTTMMINVYCATVLVGNITGLARPSVRLSVCLSRSSCKQHYQCELSVV